MYEPKEANREPNRQHTWENLLEGLWLEMLALAIAGCTTLETLPVDKDGMPVPVTRKSDATRYVHIPLSTVIKYYERGRYKSSLVLRPLCNKNDRFLLRPHFRTNQSRVSCDKLNLKHVLPHPASFFLHSLQICLRFNGQICRFCPVFVF